MVTAVTINRPDVVALIEVAAQRLTGGNKTEAVAMAVRHLLEQTAGPANLFGAHAGSFRSHDGADLAAPALQNPLDAATVHEIER